MLMFDDGVLALGGGLAFTSHNPRCLHVRDGQFLDRDTFLGVELGCRNNVPLGL